MGRNVKIRASYNNDAMFLSRLIEAVSKDTVRDRKWREQAIANLRAAMASLLDAPILPDDMLGGV